MCIGLPIMPDGSTEMELIWRGEPRAPECPRLKPKLRLEPVYSITARQILRAGDEQMDMSHVLVIAPLIIFALFFLAVLLLRSFFLMSKEEQRRERLRRGLPSGNSNDTVLEISCHNHFNNPNRNRNLALNNNSNPSPPSYYAEIMATDSSALYPVYVPPYAAPLMSLRDPRQFQGLPGLAAPPPYPPPPSYHQVNNFPGLPTAPHAVIDVAQQPRITKKRLEMSPVE